MCVCGLKYNSSLGFLLLIIFCCTLFVIRFIQEGWFPLSYVREGATSAHLLQVPGMPERSLSDNELSDADFQDHSFEEDYTGMGKFDNSFEVYLGM